MLICWSQTSSEILSQFLWFNKYIKIEGTVIHFPKFSNKGITSYCSYLKMVGWAQLKHAIPPRWKKLIFAYSNIKDNDVCQNYHVITGARILPLNKLSSKETYSILI